MAIHTKLHDEEIKNLLKPYSQIGIVQNIKGIDEGVENSNYFIDTKKQKYILTIFEKRIKNSELSFFLDLMEFFALGKIINCPQALYDKNGDRLTSVGEKKAAKKAAVFKFLEGKSTNHITPSHCYELGKFLALLHLQGKKFKQKRQNQLSLKGWQKLSSELRKNTDPKTTKLIHNVLRYINDNWPINLPKGIIHADLFPDNVFFKDKKLIAIIDFYFACYDFLAYDIAICINAWCFDQNFRYLPEHTKKLLDGYQNIRKLEINEWKELPLLIKGAALRFLLTRLYDRLHNQKYPYNKDPHEYITKMTFHMRCHDINQYLS